MQEEMPYGIWGTQATLDDGVKEVICELRSSQPYKKSSLCFCFADPNSSLLPYILTLLPVPSSKVNIFHPPRTCVN